MSASEISPADGSFQVSGAFAVAHCLPLEQSVQTSRCP